MNQVQDKREQLRAERRKQILEAALGIFMEKGYHVTNVSDVAAEAGVSQGTIYWYFESKEELFNAAIMEFFENVGQEVLSALEGASSASEKLQALSEAMVRLGEQVSGMFAMFLGYMASVPDRGAAGRFWRDLLVEYKDALVGLIREGVRTGEFREVDAESLAWAMMAAYDGLAVYLLLMPDMDVACVSRAFVDTLIGGLGKQQND